MKMHANARLSLKGRELLVARQITGEWTDQIARHAAKHAAHAA
jgi:hypothetical protein